MKVLSKSLGELAEIVGGEVIGDPNVRVLGAADIGDAAEGDIIFAENDRFFDAAARTDACAIVVRRGIVVADIQKPLLAVDDPRYAFARILESFAPIRRREAGIDPSARIGAETVVGENPSIGFNAYIGDNCIIGKNVWIYPFAYIGDGVHIGDDCVIHPFASIYDDVILGDRVAVHSGAVVGADGFGYTNVGNVHYKIPQIGGVNIGDDVEIGANTTIDRARTGETSIGRGTKVDNLVMIAHNDRIGEDCIIISQVGISGSVEVGDRAIITGQAGIKDHISIGSDAVVAGRAGVFGDIAPGAFVSGYPARDHREHMKVLAAQQKLPDLLRKIKEMEKRIKELEERTK